MSHLILVTYSSDSCTSYLAYTTQYLNIWGTIKRLLLLLKRTKWSVRCRLLLREVQTSVTEKIYCKMDTLRTVPTIVIEHTFCASRDTRISYQRCLLTREYLCAVQNYSDKAELSKSSWYPKRKLGVPCIFQK